MHQWSTAADENSLLKWHAYTTLANRCHVHADRKATCDTCKSSPNWEELVGDMNAHVAVTIAANSVKPELFCSMDETFVWFVGGACTYGERGAKSVTVSAEEQHGATIAFTFKLTDETVPIMVIYAGATQASTPGHERQVSDDAKRICACAHAAGHVITVSANHWMTKEHIQSID
eukprot:363888-Chlamydomonas_euryale.AAC.13